jgi:hypothetical protein
MGHFPMASPLEPSLGDATRRTAAAHLPFFCNTTELPRATCTTGGTVQRGAASSSLSLSFNQCGREKAKTMIMARSLRLGSFAYWH